MAATRFFRPIRPSASVVSSSASPSPATTVRCMGRTAFNNGERGLTSGDGERRQMVTVKAAVAAPETVDTKTRELDLGSLLANLLVKLKTAVGKTKIQDFIEKSIIDCRFFTLFAVAGSLLGSILCYLEVTGADFKIILVFLSHSNSKILFPTALFWNFSGELYCCRVLSAVFPWPLAEVGPKSYGGASNSSHRYVPRRNCSVCFWGGIVCNVRWTREDEGRKPPLEFWIQLVWSLLHEETSDVGGNGIGVGGEVEDRACGGDDSASGCVGEVQEYTFELCRRSRLFRRRRSDLFRLHLFPL